MNKSTPDKTASPKRGPGRPKKAPAAKKDLQPAAEPPQETQEEEPQDGGQEELRNPDCLDDVVIPGVKYNTTHRPVEYTMLKSKGENFYSAKEAAALMSVHVRTVYRMVSAREIGYFTIRGRIQIPERAINKAAIPHDVKGKDAGTHGIVYTDPDE